MRRKLLLIIVIAMFVSGLSAQTARDEIYGNMQYAAGFYTSYAAPAQLQDTPAPVGYKPFHISHYGCHGSRYHTSANSYDTPYTTLAKADSLGKLTDLGRDVLRRISFIRDDADMRWGELSDLGFQQQREIMSRMMTRFPDVFSANVDIDARSTTLTRCILSMESALVQLAQNGMFTFHQDATKHDTHFLNYEDKKLMTMQMDSTATANYNALVRKLQKPDRFISLIFNDTAYVREHINAGSLYSSIFRLGGNLQNMDYQLSLYDLFTKEEAYNNWKIANAWSYINYGGYTGNGGLQPYTQRYLLRQMIMDADSCLYMASPSVDLRFGDETGIIPLSCLLDINGYGLATDNLETLDEMGWADYRISPVAANIQFILYRRDRHDDDVLIKVLLNERETRLPLHTDCAPYYCWKEFCEYYLNKLDAYEE